MAGLFNRINVFRSRNEELASTDDRKPSWWNCFLSLCATWAVSREENIKNLFDKKTKTNTRKNRSAMSASQFVAKSKLSVRLEEGGAREQYIVMHTMKMSKLDVEKLRHYHPDNAFLDPLTNMFPISGARTEGTATKRVRFLPVVQIRHYQPSGVDN